MGRRCPKHNESVTHKTADESWKMFQNAQKTGRVDQQLDPQFRDNEAVTLYQTHILTVLDILLFLAQQELALKVMMNRLTRPTEETSWNCLISFASMTQVSKKSFISFLKTVS